MSVSRRQVLTFGGLGIIGAGALSVPFGSISAKSASKLADADMPIPYRTSLTVPPILQPYAVGRAPDGAKVHYYSVTQRAGTARILPRLTTPILGYNGIFPGPTIDLLQGTRAVLKIRNQLPQTHPLHGHTLSTSTHLHGSASLPQFDGYASDVTHPGFAKNYEYPNFQSARTLWYHDHNVHTTAENAYSGLSAQFCLHDPAERELLPQDEFDIPLTLSDAMFAADGSLAYDDNTHSGLWGDVILVNGKPWPVMKVQRRVYRFRILNASISRSFRPTLSTGEGVHIVATDGGLMAKTETVDSWRHAGAERYEILVDFSAYQPGQRVELRNLSNKNNIDYDFTDRIMAFDVTDEPVDTADPTWKTIPQTLASHEVMELRPARDTRVRKFEVKRNDDVWVIGEDSWADIIASGYRRVCADPALGATEIWEFENSSGGWFHPIHIHLVDFQILSRNGRAPFSYEMGPKDVVYVGEGETVRLLMKFGPHRGKYMIHCHNLPHEDHDMMTQFSVGLKPGQVDLNDPMKAAPAFWDGQ